LGKGVHLNRLGKKHSSGFGLPPIAVTKINKQKEKDKKKKKIKQKNKNQI